MELEISRQIFELVQWEPSCYLPTDRRTDMTTLKVTFRNFADASKNGGSLAGS